VRSSTSSSDEPLELPRRSLLGLGLAALGVGAAGVGATELFWRSRGFVPELRDSVELWCRAREEANAVGRRALALVGSSRFQLGLDPAVLGARLPALSPVQLSINGSPALPVFRELAADARFSGTVLCEVMPQNFFTASALRADAVPWLTYWRTRPAVGAAEGHLREVLQARLALLQPSLDLHTVTKRVVQGQGLPQPSYVQLRADRFMVADYTKVDKARQLRHWLARARERQPPSAAELQQVLAAVSQSYQQLRQRGGRVIFVRMISSLELRRVEDELFPPQVYWDDLLRVTGAQGIYDSEVSGAEALSCPDGSHLDAAQAATFSAGLADLLKSRGLS
jgi:hypothetical protein